jgi:hypothetical protein
MYAKAMWSLRYTICTKLLVGSLAISSLAYAGSGCPSDMKEVHIGKATSCIPDDNASAEDRIKSDPKYAEFVKGRWQYIRPKTAKPGEFCAVAFLSAEFMVFVQGPGADYRGALLRFSSSKIPRPNTTDDNAMVKQKITLTQAPDPPQTFTALLSSDKAIKSGVISVAVPSVEAAIESMTDEQSFKIEMDGRVVLEGKWHDGLKAAQELRACRQAR